MNNKNKSQSNEIKFEKVSKYKDIDFTMPQRATKCSAGYDFVAAADVVIPPYETLMKELKANVAYNQDNPLTLDEMAIITKSFKVKPTLVSTGVKCKMPNNMYLKLVNRSSMPLKYWIIKANSEGIIDADYYNNKDNEGEIFFQFINFSPFPIVIHKGDKIGQGIFHHFYLANDDKVENERIGGFGSTNI